MKRVSKVTRVPIVHLLHFVVTWFDTSELAVGFLSCGFVLLKDRAPFVFNPSMARMCILQDFACEAARKLVHLWCPVVHHTVQVYRNEVWPCLYSRIVYLKCLLVYQCASRQVQGICKYHLYLSEDTHVPSDSVVYRHIRSPVLSCILLWSTGDNHRQ